jgi:hypothetical protein
MKEAKHKRLYKIMLKKTGQDGCLFYGLNSYGKMFL